MSNARRPAYPVDLEGINNIAKDAFKAKKDTTVEEVQASIFPHTGLTKRERFAMAAMQGILSNPEYIRELRNVMPDDSLEDAISKIAKAKADSLLAELEKTEEE